MTENKRDKGISILKNLEDYTVIDLETTGRGINTCSIIEISAIRIRNNQIIDTFTTLVNPEEPIPKEVIDLTGITNEMVLNKPTIKNCISDFIKFLGDDILVGHNIITFDSNIIYDKALYFLDYKLKNNFLDTLYFAKHCNLDVPNYKLTTLQEYLNVTNDKQHRSLSDCIATHECYQKLKSFFRNRYVPHQAISSKSDETYSYYDEPKQTLELTKLELKALEIIEKSFELNNLEFKKEIILKPMSENWLSLFSTNGKYLFKLKVGTIAKWIALNKNYCQEELILDNKFTYENEENYLKIRLTSLENIIDVCDLVIKCLLCAKYCYSYDDLKKQNIKLPDLKDFDFSNTTKQKSKKQNYYSKYNHANIRDIVAKTDIFNECHPLFGKVCVFTGTLERFSRAEAMQIVVDFGGINASGVTKKTNFLVLGNNDFCQSIKDGKSSKQKKAEQLLSEGQDIKIISEDTFYDMAFNNDNEEVLI